MERLTKHYRTLSDGSPLFELKELEGEPCITLCSARGDHCKYCPIGKAFNRLAVYEDTGLKPEDIMAKDKKIKQVFCEFIMRMEKARFEVSTRYRHKVLFAMREAIELYSQIYELPYAEADKELHGSNDQQCRRRFRTHSWGAAVRSVYCRFARLLFGGNERTRNVGTTKKGWRK